MELRAHDRPVSEARDRGGPHSAAEVASVDTVEAAVRAQLSKALGGRRGMVEAGVPTVLFTIIWLTTKNLQSALLVSLAVAVALLVVRVVQRSSVQFALNAIVGIGIGWFFVTMSARSGGSEDDQALAYFLPGIIYNAGYSAVLAFTCLIGWPLVGFMVGSVTGDPTAWHRDRQVVKLCSRLTWVLVAPCILRVAVQAPLWFGAKSGALDTDVAIATLGILKLVMGWPLQLAALTLMVWLLARNSTPVEGEPAAVLGGDERSSDADPS